MRIEVPENTQTFGDGATCLHTLCLMQNYLGMASRAINDKYKGTYPIDDLAAFEIGAYNRVITNLRSFKTLCLIGNDYNSCCTLARSIADSISALKLIYESNDPDEITFRHYLYILDGISQRLKLLPKSIINNGRITDKECEQLKNQCDKARRNSEDVISYCTSALLKHKYATKYPLFTKQAIQTKAWKYKNFELTNRGNIVGLSWKEMYAQLDSRESIISMYSNYFSQFVHGLSISCLPCINDEDNLDSIASVGVCLQGLVKKRIEVVIGDSIIKKYATLEDVKNMLSLYSTEKRNELLRKAYEDTQRMAP